MTSFMASPARLNDDDPGGGGGFPALEITPKFGLAFAEAAD
jgi:hypothetical protein